jgi:glycerol kinase
VQGAVLIRPGPARRSRRDRTRGCALGGVGAGVIGSLTELPEMLPAERRVEPEREESWRTTEHERWREFVRATEALDPH